MRTIDNFIKEYDDYKTPGDYMFNFRLPNQPSKEDIELIERVCVQYCIK